MRVLTTENQRKLSESEVIPARKEKKIGLIRKSDVLTVFARAADRGSVGTGFESYPVLLVGQKTWFPA
jgi:hypothetical protein